MSNLTSAKDSLAAELAYAREGMAFYLSRAKALEETLASLDALDSETLEDYKNDAATGVKKRKQKEAGGTRKRGQGLPSTGREFWLGLIQQEPRSGKEILEAAVAALGINPSKDELKKLAQRQANALHMLVKENALSDSGSGRDRRFHRSA